MAHQSLARKRAVPGGSFAGAAARFAVAMGWLPCMGAVALAACGDAPGREPQTAAAVQPAPATARPFAAGTRAAATPIHVARFDANFSLVGNPWQLPSSDSDVEFLAKRESATVAFMRWQEKAGTSPLGCAQNALARGLLSAESLAMREPGSDLALGTASRTAADGTLIEVWVYLEANHLRGKRVPLAGHVVLLAARGRSCGRAWYTERIASGAADDSGLGARLAEQQALWLRSFAFAPDATLAVPPASAANRK